MGVLCLWDKEECSYLGLVLFQLRKCKCRLYRRCNGLTFASPVCLDASVPDGGTLVLGVTVQPSLLLGRWRNWSAKLSRTFSQTRVFPPMNKWCLPAAFTSWISTVTWSYSAWNHHSIFQSRSSSKESLLVTNDYGFRLCISTLNWNARRFVSLPAIRMIKYATQFPID